MCLKKLAGLTLAGFMAVSAVAVPVNAAAQGSESNCPKHSLVLKETREYRYDPAPTYHTLLVVDIYECVYCDYTETVENKYFEDHDYVFNSVTFEYVCRGCGDVTK